MTIDRNALNAERDELGAIVADLCKSFAAEFETVKQAEPMTVRPLTFLTTSELQESEGPVEILTHYEAFGIGNTPQDAMADFRQKMSTWPTSGKFIFWRATPECDWAYDFMQGKPVWKIYARAAIK